MTKLIILGSSSGLPQAERATSGYLLKTGQKLTLIDCGGGVTGSFLKRGYNPLDVDRIFISHTHPDHVCELPLFIQLIYLKGRNEPLEIFLPEEFIEPFTIYLKSVYLILEKLPFEINLHPVTDNYTYESDLFSLNAIANTHLKGYEEFIAKLNLPNKMQCHSFKIQVGEKSLFYSADIGSFDDIKNHLDNTTVAIIESTHINLDDFFNFAADSTVERFILTHLGTTDEIANLNQQADKHGVHNITTAMDGMEIEL